MTALGVVRSLARAGIDRLLLAPRDDIAHRCRWARPLEGVRSDAADRPLAEVLRTAPLESAVLIPGSDSAALEMASLPPDLARRFPVSIPPRASLEILVDKLAFASFMQEQGLPHPKTVDPRRWSPNGGDPIDSLDDDFFSNAFLKPRDSQRFFRTFGVKAFPVRSRAEARRLLGEIESRGLSAVLQEYVPGPPTEHVFLDGFVDGGGRISHLLARRRSRMYPHDFGNSTLCETIRTSEVPGAVETMRRLLDTLSYRGIFSAEVKHDARTGEYRVLEVNARAWWYVEFAARCGVNVCEAAYRDARHEDVGAAREPAPGIRLVYPSYDLAAFHHHRSRVGRNGRSTLDTWQWFRPWLGAKQALFVADDPIPAISEVGRRVGRKIRNRVGRTPVGKGAQP